MRAPTEHEFYQLVAEFDENTPAGPAKDYLKSWWAKPQEFANFILRRNRTLNKRGSAAAEQNHASIAAMIGASNDDISRMVAALLDREAERTKQEGTELARLHLKSSRVQDDCHNLMKFAHKHVSVWGTQILEV